MTAHALARALLERADVPVVVPGQGVAAFVTRAALADGGAAVVLYLRAPEPEEFALVSEAAS